MKKRFKSFALLLLFMVMFPVTMFLTGCGATPSNEVKGVFFVSDKYDKETGYAIFEVDKGVKTKLDYKINPSSWSGYAISYAFKEASGENLSRFKFTKENGCININSSDFEEIKVVIMVNKKSDTCIVRLKKYPTNMFLLGTDKETPVQEKEININALGSYTISPYGRFVDAEGNPYTKSLLEMDYKFKVTSDDETVISVPNEDRLKIYSVRKGSGSAKVTVSLLDATGKALFTVKVKVNVVRNAEKAVTVLSNYDKFVMSGDKLNFDASQLDVVDADKHIYEITQNTFLKAEGGVYIDEGYIEYAMTASNDRYVDIEDNKIIIKKGGLSELTFKVYVWTNLVKADMSVFMSSFTITVKF